MDDKTQKILNDANRSVIQYRGMYAKWCAMHGVGYNEMLVFYTIREFGYCTQKQICEISTVTKPISKLNITPRNVNNSISETPITMSGLIIGMFDAF